MKLNKCYVLNMKKCHDESRIDLYEYNHYKCVKIFIINVLYIYYVYFMYV